MVERAQVSEKETQPMATNTSSTTYYLMALGSVESVVYLQNGINSTEVLGKNKRGDMIE